MPGRKERVIRRSYRKVASAGKKGWAAESSKTCWDSIGGFFVGLILFFVAFGLPYCAAKTEKVSNQLKKVDVITAAEVGNRSGLALVSGTLEAGSKLNPPKQSVPANILAFEYIVENYETWTEERTRTETDKDGNTYEVTEDVEVTDWRKDEDASKLVWAPVMMGDLSLTGTNTSRLPWDRAFYFQNADQTHRETIMIVKGGIEALWAVDLANGQVHKEARINEVSTEGKDELIARHHSQEETSRWMLIIGSVILWTIAFNLLIGPAMIMINIIPIKQIGAALRGIITFFSFIMACLLCWTTYVAVKYWWVVVIMIIVLAGVVVYFANRQKEPHPDLEPDEDLEPEPDPET